MIYEGPGVGRQVYPPRKGNGCLSRTQAPALGLEQARWKRLPFRKLLWGGSLQPPPQALWKEARHPRTTAPVAPPREVPHTREGAQSHPDGTKQDIERPEPGGGFEKGSPAERRKVEGWGVTQAPGSGKLVGGAAERP